MFLDGKEFQIGGKVLLFNSKLKPLAGKLSLRWLGPFQVIKTYPHGIVKLIKFSPDRTLKMNCHRLKHFYKEDQVQVAEEIKFKDRRAFSWVEPTIVNKGTGPTLLGKSTFNFALFSSFDIY